jgi:hypothetical protein
VFLQEGQISPQRVPATRWTPADRWFSLHRSLTVPSATLGIDPSAVAGARVDRFAAR